MKNEPAVAENTSSQRKQFPVRTIVFSLLVLATILGLKFGAEWLNDAINLDPGMPNVLTLVLSFVVWLAWLFWLVLCTKGRALGRLLNAAVWILIPVSLIAVFQPIFDGDLKIVGWRYRFAQPTASHTDIEPANVSVAGSAVWQASSQDFPQFLGAQRNATIQGVSLAEDWQARTPQIIWKQSIGEGWSGFAIVGDLAFTQEQLGEQECVSCYKIETGELAWRHSGLRRHEDMSAMGRVGPRATPTVVDEKVYTMGGTGVLECLSAIDGSLAWSVDVPAAVGIDLIEQVNTNGLKYAQENSTLTWGRSASPLIYEDLVIVPGGGPENEKPGSAVTLLAYDRETGKEKWRGGEHQIAYGSPSLTEVLGNPQVVLIAESSVVGHDPDTGQELWSHPWPGNSNGDANCSQVTTVSHSESSTLLLASKGYGAGGELLEVSRYEDKFVTTTLAKSSRVLKTKLTNPVLLDGYAYSLSDGFLECAQLPTLERKWKKRGRFGNGQVLLVGDKLLVHSETGTLYLVAATPEGYQEFGKVSTIKGVCWNTMALSGDRLLVRSELEAALIKLPLTN